MIKSKDENDMCTLDLDIYFACTNIISQNDLKLWKSWESNSSVMQLLIEQIKRCSQYWNRFEVFFFFLFVCIVWRFCWSLTKKWMRHHLCCRQTSYDTFKWILFKSSLSWNATTTNHHQQNTNDVCFRHLFSYRLLRAASDNQHRFISTVAIQCDGLIAFIDRFAFVRILCFELTWMMRKRRLTTHWFHISTNRRVDTTIQ